MKLPQWLHTKTRKRVDQLWVYLNYVDREGSGKDQYAIRMLSADDTMKRFQELYDFLKVDRKKWEIVQSRLVPKSSEPTPVSVSNESTTVNP